MHNSTPEREPSLSSWERNAVQTARRLDRLGRKALRRRDAADLLELRLRLETMRNKAMRLQRRSPSRTEARRELLLSMRAAADLIDRSSSSGPSDNPSS